METDLYARKGEKEEGFGIVSDDVVKGRSGNDRNEGTKSIYKIETCTSNFIIAGPLI